MENRTNRGSSAFREPVDSRMKTTKPPKGIAFNNATNGANGPTRIRPSSGNSVST